jgi:alpha-methylacyl-CoA racemase
VGAQEDRFFLEFAGRLGLDADWASRRRDRRNWPALREGIAQRGPRKTRSEGEAVFAGSDSCVAPVLSWLKVADHGRMKTHGTVVERPGVMQPAAVPRSSRTEGSIGQIGERTPAGDILENWRE